jgi:hypothetical protein
MIPNYEDLIARLRELETKKNTKSARSPTSKKPFHFSSHPKRKIAIKFLLGVQWSDTSANSRGEVLFKASDGE